MLSIDSLFVLIIQFSAFAFILLATGVIALKFFQQPVERIRLIQISLASVFIVLIIGQTSWKPTINLPWLPASDQLGNRIGTADETGDAIHSGEIGMANPNFLRSKVAEAGATSSEGNSNTSGSGSAAVLTHSAFEPQARAASKSSTRGSAWQIAKTIFVISFGIICCFQAAYLLAGFVWTRRLVTSANSLPQDELEKLQRILKSFRGRRVRLVVSDNISVPIATGIFRPSIVLPQHLFNDGEDSLKIEHSLAHEWKHLERNDVCTWQLTSCCQILLWPQPFYWWLRRELRVSQDQIADEFATQTKDQRAVYAATLLEFSKAGQPAWLGTLTMAGSKSNLYRRVEMLLSQKFQIAGISRKPVVLAFATLMATAGMLLVSLQLTNAANRSAPGTGSTVQEGDSDKTNKKQDPEAKATEPVEHTGFVVDAVDGKPIADATVIITRMNSKTWTEIEVTESKTDSNGKYTFTIPPAQYNERYLYIMFDLRHETFAPRHAASYSYSMIKKNLKLGDPPWFEKLTMVPGTKLSGRLVDGKGNPVKGTAVRIASSSPAAGWEGWSSHESVTGDDGRFDAIVTKEGTASLSLIPQGHCMKNVDVGTKRGDLGDIKLTEGVSIKGQILDAIGKPIEGLWVNLNPTDVTGQSSYEMRRSSRSGADGSFLTRPLKPGKYQLQVQTKATGALEKERYANFKDDPPPAVFIRQTIEVVADTADQPFVIQAVPHVYIRGQCYNSKGEITSCHFPELIGNFNGQTVWIRSTKGKQVGAFELRVPHGVETQRLSFMTNEHSALTVQMPGKSVSTQRMFGLGKIEEDITGIKVVRYVAPILQVKLVDESGKPVKDAKVAGNYQQKPDQPKTMQAANVYPTDDVYFELQKNGVYRSSSMVPDREIEIFATKDGFESERKKVKMEEGKNNTITIKLKQSEKKTKAEDKKSTRLPIKE